MKQTILIFVGESGAGKTTITQLFVAHDGYTRYPTLTTRGPRNGEIDGDDYHFVSSDEYDSIRRSGGLYNDIAGNGYRYGIPKALLSERGQKLILHLDHTWAMKLKQDLHGAIVIRIKAPNEAEQRRRLKLRGESEEKIDQRVGETSIQSPPDVGYDLVVVNETGDIAGTYEKIRSYLG